MGQSMSQLPTAIVGLFDMQELLIESQKSADTDSLSIHVARIGGRCFQLGGYWDF